jgi:EmrB/QacA subfamily drug resistance transporter
VSGNGATPGATVEAEAPPALSHRQIMVIFSGLMLGMFLAALDQTIVATALPRITDDLGGLDHLSWVVTAYLLASTVSTPLYGKLGDLFGRKKLYQGAIVIFFVGSVCSGLAQDMAQLIAARAVQSLGAGGLIVLAQALIGDTVSPRERGRYMGYFGAVFGFSSVAGPLLGGFLTDNLSWRWVFYVNVPIAIAAFAVTGAVLPKGHRVGNPRIDYVGSAILVAAVSCLVLWATWGGTEYAWDSPTIVGLGLAALVLLGVLVVVERRVAEPVIPVHLFSVRSFNVVITVSFIVGAAMFGAISFLPLFLQVVTGASATNSGLLLLPLMLGLLTASTGSGQIISRTGRYKFFPLLGTALATLAMFLLASMGPDTTGGTVALYMVILGAGLGFTMQTLILAVQNAVGPGDMGVATSSATFFRSMGGSLGVALFGALFNARLSDNLGTTTAVGESGSSSVIDALEGLTAAQRTFVETGFADAITSVFLYGVPLLLVAFGVTWFLSEVPLRSSTHAVDHGREMAAGSAPGTAEPEVVSVLH